MLAITNESDFLANISNGLVAVKFWATWCGPCKAFEPNMAKIEKEFGQSVKFYSIDIDQIPVIAQKYRIRTLPTVLLLNNEKEINRITGLVLIEPLRKSFTAFCKVNER